MVNNAVMCNNVIWKHLYDPEKQMWKFGFQTGKSLAKFYLDWTKIWFFPGFLKLNQHRQNEM